MRNFSLFVAVLLFWLLLEELRGRGLSRLLSAERMTALIMDALDGLRFWMVNWKLRAWAYSLELRARRYDAIARLLRLQARAIRDGLKLRGFCLQLLRIGLLFHILKAENPLPVVVSPRRVRSEERRVGKEC